MTQQLQTPPSPLQRLLGEIKAQEREGKVEKGKLLGVAENLASAQWRLEDHAARAEARQVLAKYHLSRLTTGGRTATLEKIRAEAQKAYRSRCSHCGRQLTNPLSVSLGEGPVCRRREEIRRIRMEAQQRLEEMEGEA